MVVRSLADYATKKVNEHKDYSNHERRKKRNGYYKDDKEKSFKGTKGHKKKKYYLRKLKLGKGDMRRKKSMRTRSIWFFSLSRILTHLFDTHDEAADKCPDKAVYRENDIIGTEYGIGSIQLVLQSGFGGNDLLEPCAWIAFKITMKSASFTFKRHYYPVP